MESEAGIFTFDINVTAGQMMMFTGEIKLDGRSFVTDSLMSALNNSFVSVTAVTGANTPEPAKNVPTPAPVLLLLTGLLGLLAR